MLLQRIGIDTGGTFTDSVAIDAYGRTSVVKVRSSPQDPSKGAAATVDAAAQGGALDAAFEIVHGTTVATNALLQRLGARTALVTTQGFRDVLEIGRQSRSHLYNLRPARLAPLLPSDQRFDVAERIDWQGRVVSPLDEETATRLCAELVSSRFESVAVCFLFSYLNPAHEARFGEIARAHGLSASLSCEISAEPREYERTATTTANAFVAPVMSHYLASLDLLLRERGATSVQVMQSNGGTVSPGTAARQPVRTVLSGPAGGVAAALRLAARIGAAELFTFDMGGTSTDVALIAGGKARTTTLAEVAGIPIRLPMLEITTIAAGGGSVAWFDSAGGLRVGPQSAGADPGPAAYGAGERLTVTDANVLLGRLPERVRLAGTLPLDRGRVERLFAPFAAQLGVDSQHAAMAIVAIAEAAMARALRMAAAQHGQDPAGIHLLSFGGAGGLHACALAEELGLAGVIVPRYPGAFSAIGLALAPWRREYTRALPAWTVLPGSPADDRPQGGLTLEEDVVEAAFSELAHAAHRDAAADAVGEVALAQSVDLRYSGQSYELSVALPTTDLRVAAAEFHALHRRTYGYAGPGAPIEAVALRLTAESAARAPEPYVTLPESAGGPVAESEVVFDRPTPAMLFERDDLAAGQQVDGPAVVLQSDATTLIPPEWRARVDDWGNLRMDRRPASPRR